MRRILSLAAIGEIERAYAHGAPCLGVAASALLERWRFPVRDHETLLRLAFLSWYADHEPGWLTGMDAELPTVDSLISDVGGEEKLPPEALFTLAVLWNLLPPLGADHVLIRQRASDLASRAAATEPSSRLFAAWPFVLGHVSSLASARMYLEQEAHARYHGRGAMGDYMLHLLGSRLRPGTEQGCTAV